MLVQLPGQKPVSSCRMTASQVIPKNGHIALYAQEEWDCVAADISFTSLSHLDPCLPGQHQAAAG